MVGHASERHRKGKSEVGDLSKKEEVELEDVDKPKEVRSEVKESKESSPEVEIRFQDAMKELKVQENKEDNISHKMEEALGELREMESKKETTESKIKEAIDSLEEPVNDTEPQLRTEIGSKPDVLDDYECKIESMEEFNQAQERYSDIETRGDYEDQLDETKKYFEDDKEIKDSPKPDLVEEIERRETRRLYETVHDGPPEVRIESMQDVDKLLEEHPEEKERKRFDEQYRHCKVYFEVKDQHGPRREELAEEYNVCHTYIGYWRNGVEPIQIQRLREKEEERIIKEWSESKPQISEEKIREFRHSEIQERKEVDDGRTGVHKMNDEVVREATSHLRERESITKEDIVKTTEKLLQPNLGENVRIRYADIKGELTPEKISEIQKILQDNQKEIEEAVSKKLDLENPRTRIALVNEKIYTWTPEIRKDELVNAYEDQFYYFKNNREIGHIAEELQKRLGIEGNQREALKQLNEVTRQLTVGDDGKHSRTNPIGGKTSRLEGKVIRMYLDSTDKRLSDLEGRVTKVAGKSGTGGIRSPKFPEGTDLEREITRLTAIVVSDGSVGPKGYIDYCEGNVDRFNHVEKSLGVWGDIELKRYHRKNNSGIESQFPTPLGKLLLEQGFQPGDKSINNERLPLNIEKMSIESKRVYLQELIPEDGHFSAGTGFQWSRSVVLATSSENTTKYGFESEISPEHISFLKERGTPYKTKPIKYVPRGTLESLSNSDDSEVARTAKSLQDIIKKNESNLMKDENEIAKSFGFKTNTNYVQIRYSQQTGRVSVYWGTTTSGAHEAMKWGISCPPNDVRKRNAVREWIRQKPEKIKVATDELNQRQIPYEDWWI